MARPRKESVCSAGDLAWFDSRKYAELSKGDPELWARTIIVRASLQNLLDQGPNHIDDVKREFAKLQTEPLGANDPESLRGFAIRTTSRNKCDTGSVKLMTMGRVHSFSAEFSAIDMTSPCAAIAVDELLCHRENTANNFVHLSVNLLAPDSQIKSDLTRLLRNWRRKREREETLNVNSRRRLLKTLDHWHENGLIPFFDLNLFATLYGKSISAKDLRTKLNLDQTIGREALRRRLTALKKTVLEAINLDTAFKLRSQTAPPAVKKRTSFQSLKN